MLMTPTIRREAIQRTFDGVIQSIGYDQQELIEGIIQLHCPEGIELDPTYSRGGFYSKRIPRPKYCFDIDPLAPEIQQADCRQLPIKKESIRSIMFDPPFLATSSRNGNYGKMCAKYSYVDSMPDLFALYTDSLQELSRVLLPAGILIFKCQDTVYGSRNYFSHVWVMTEAERIGFRAIDLFIKLNKTALISWNYEIQHHARKLHSYFWVFKKPPISGRRGPETRDLVASTEKPAAGGS